MKLQTTRSYILEKAGIYTADITKTQHLTTSSTTLITFLNLSLWIVCSILLLDLDASSFSKFTKNKSSGINYGHFHTVWHDNLIY